MPTDNPKESIGFIVKYNTDEEDVKQLTRSELIDLLIGEEDISKLLSKTAKVYKEKDSEHGEEYPVRAVPHYLWLKASKSIIRHLKG